MFITTMGQLNWECCAVLFLLYFLSTFLTVESYYKDNDGTSKRLKQIHQWYTKPGSWLENDVNRKKRNVLYEDNYKTPYIDSEQLDTIMDTIQEHPWSIIAVNEGKRHTNNFTPRLGRESDEENEQNWLRDPEINKDILNPRSPPFAPRLGRRMNAFYFDPRLTKRNLKKN